MMTYPINAQGVQEGVAMYFHPEIVIAVPVFNEEKFISEALQSIRDQSHQNFLVVVGDNCSTDTTREIVSKFCETDSRFVLHKNESNIGAARNFEFLYRQTESPYFMWMGAHDRIAKNFLEKHIGFLNKNGEYTLSYSSIRQIDSHGEEKDITAGSGLDEVTDASPWKRYRKSITKLGECTAINHPFRRALLADFHFPLVAGVDHIMLSRIMFSGKINRFSAPLYERRVFDVRAANYMERITGDRSKRPKEKNLFQTKIEYLRDFLSLPRSVFIKVFYLPGIVFAVDKKFTLGFFWLKRLVGDVLRQLGVKK